MFYTGERSINLFINVTFLFEMFEFLTTNPLKWLQKYILTQLLSCADPEWGGGTGDRESGPPLEFENFTLKKVISGLLGVGPPLVCDQKLPFSLDPLS